MSNNVILNKKASHKYFLSDKVVAGISLQGWEVKSICAKKINIDNSYVVVRNGELFLFNALISPNKETSTHVLVEENRSRKLLLHKSEINRFIGAVEAVGVTIVPTRIIIGRKIKVEIALAKGKKEYDKRQDIKDRDWSRQKEMLFKSKVKKNI